MSGQPWKVMGGTVYQLTDAENENVWSAHVQGPRLSFDDAAKVAQKIAAAPDMAEALKEARDCVLDCLNAENEKRHSRAERADYYAGLLAQVDAALAKAGARERGA